MPWVLGVKFEAMAPMRWWNKHEPTCVRAKRSPSDICGTARTELQHLPRKASVAMAADMQA